MVKVGLTGASGSGKTSVCQYFEKIGIPCLDTDRVSRELTAPGTPCFLELTERFGRDILFPDGNLDRKKLAKIAYSDQKNYLDLNRITHGYIVPDCLNWLDEKEKSGVKAAVLDAPLLYESGLDRYVDCIVAVIAPLPVRIRRITLRDHLDEDSVRLRLLRQHPDGYYIGRSNCIIVNDCDEETLVRRIKRILPYVLSFRQR